jgi:hypothetical protein
MMYITLQGVGQSWRRDADVMRVQASADAIAPDRNFAAGMDGLAYITGPRQLF